MSQPKKHRGKPQKYNYDIEKIAQLESEGLGDNEISRQLGYNDGRNMRRWLDSNCERREIPRLIQYVRRDMALRGLTE